MTTRTYRQIRWVAIDGPGQAGCNALSWFRWDAPTFRVLQAALGFGCFGGLREHTLCIGVTAQEGCGP